MARLSPPTQGFVRHTHPDGFRTGEWAQIIMILDAYERPCWLVEFSDGVTDLWVCEDASEPYEFSSVNP
jgi:hypothetical protein